MTSGQAGRTCPYMCHCQDIMTLGIWEDNGWNCGQRTYTKSQIWEYGNRADGNMLVCAYE